MKNRIEPILAGFALALVAVTILSAAAWIVVLDTDGTEPLETTVAEIARESAATTNRFLDTAETAANIARQAVDQHPSADDAELAEILQYVSTAEDTIDGIFVGYGDGTFLYVTKSLATVEGGLRVKVITDADLATRGVIETQLDATLQPVTTVELFDDDFDPRVRPWYQGAEIDGRGWTEPYTFASSGEPGITYYTQHPSFAETGAVVGVDMRLDAVVSFLEARQVGPNGFTAIVQPNGARVGGPNEIAESLLAMVGEVPSVDGEPVVLNDSTNQAVVAFTPIAESGVSSADDWRLVVAAKESDFVNLVGDGRRAQVAVAGVAAGVVALVAILSLVARSRLKRLRRQATSDAETGLLTRAEVHRNLELLIEEGQRTVVVSIAMENLNLGLEPHAADELLKSVGETLRALTGANGVAGRTGAREFMVAASTDSRNAKRVVQEISNSIAALHSQGASETITQPVSIGWCETTGVRAGDDLSVVLRRAGLALLAAEAGPDSIVEYHERLQPRAVVDARQRREIAKAIDERAFRLHFQPEVDLETGRVHGAEALLRRVRSTGRIEPAGVFIDDLERLGLLPRLTHQLLDMAIDFALRWSGSDFVVRINLAASELNDSSIRARLHGITERTGVNWCIEITERTIERLDADAIVDLRHLARSGIEIALDDFGTGYSSMAELTRLPVTTLKIDRSFVEPLGDGATAPASFSVASLVQQVASQLSLDVVAEGVETEMQRDALIEMGCVRGQGWLIAADMSPNDFVAWAGQRVVDEPDQAHSGA